MKIHVKPTMSCNLSCYYCNEKRDDKRMSIATLERIVSLIAEVVHFKHVRRIEFEWSGGEPLLLGASFFRDAFRFQQEKIRTEVSNTVYSNLLLLDDEMADLLSETRVEVYTSLDDLGANSLRRGSSSRYFDLFDARLSLLLSRGLKVKLYTTVTGQNVAAIRDLYRYANRHGLDFDFSNVQYPFMEPDRRLQELAPEPGEFEREAIQLFDDWFRSPSRHAVIKPFYAVIRFLVSGTRPKPTALVSFDSDGRLYLCPFDISKRSPFCGLAEISGVDLAELVARNCCGPTASRVDCNGCEFKDFCNWMLCKDRTEGASISAEAQFHNTCRYWKPIFEHIRQQVISDLTPRRSEALDAGA